jgi:hypothetical protein
MKLILILSLTAFRAIASPECGDSWKKWNRKASMSALCPGNAYSMLLIGDYWYKFYDGMLFDMSNEYRMPVCGYERRLSNLCEETFE